MPAVSAPLESLDTPSLTQFAHATQALKSVLTKPLIDAITYELSFLDRTLVRWKKQDALIAPLLTDVPPYRELPADSPYFFNRFTQNTAEKIEYFTKLFDRGFGAIAAEEADLIQSINRLRLELENYLTDALALNSPEKIAAEKEAAQKYAYNRHYAEKIDAFAQQLREWLASI